MLILLILLLSGNVVAGQIPLARCGAPIASANCVQMLHR